jgi:hypothetical protein
MKEPTAIRLESAPAGTPPIRVLGEDDQPAAIIAQHDREVHVRPEPGYRIAKVAVTIEMVPERPPQGSKDGEAA